MSAVPRLSPCLDEDALARYLDRALSPVERSDAEHHLATCPECLAAVGAFGRIYAGELDGQSAVIAIPTSRGAGGAQPMAVLTPGTAVGRYRVLSLLGEGGMGVVYAAHDPELRRRVALKLVRASWAADDHDRERLLREAQLMATLTHPNVVGVFDVGLFEDSVFVAMEYVEGATLRSWAEAMPRRTSEVLAVLLQAGEGLAAAHRAGLIHRDFKPDNVLVGVDGRTRVTDFGLARRADEGSELGRTGGLLGTPAYMAPEQRAGSQADASSDQYSFCVTACEALGGGRPLVDETGGRRPRRLPRRVWAALRRGLSPDVASRWPTMDALLLALRRDPALHWQRIAFSLAALATVGTATSFTMARVAERRTLVCSGASRQLDGVWDADRRRAVEEAFRATKAPYAADAWRRVEASLDGYGRAWVDGHTDACVATRVRGDQSDEVLTRRMECLDARLRELRALTTTFAAADGDMVARAPSAVSRLRPPSDCADLPMLASYAGLPAAGSAERRAQIEDVRGALAGARALERAGKIEAGFVAATGIVGRAREIGYRPLEAEALAALASLDEERADLTGAVAALMAALDAGEAGHHDMLVAELWPRVIADSARLARFDDAARARARARAAFERIGKSGGARWLLPEAEGELAFEQGRYAESAELYRAALTAREQVEGEGSLGLAGVAAHLGDAERHLGQQGEAIAAYERSAELRERILGPHHPELAESLDGLAMAYDRVGRYGEARRLLERAIAIDEAAFGPDHPSLAEHLSNLALAMRDDGETTAVIPLLERAERLMVAAKGDAHPDVATARASLGLAYLVAGNLGRARSYHESALAIRRAALGPNHPRVAISLYYVAEVAFAAHDLGKARALYLEALAIDEKALGPADPHLATDLVGLVRTELALRRPDRALAHAERALTLRSSRPGRPRELADAQFAVARALAASSPSKKSRHDQTRALALATDALANYRRDGGIGERQAADVERWLGGTATIQPSRP